MTRGADTDTFGGCTNAVTQPAEEEQGADDGEHELDRLLPLQLRLAARALAHVHGDLLDPQPFRLQSQQRLDLGRAAHIGPRQHGHRLRVDGGHAARRIVEPPAEPHVHRLLQQADAEAPARRRQVAVGVVSVAGREARADGDVADIRADELEQARQLGRRVLAVGVDPAAERVTALVCLAIAGGDSRPQPAVLPERDDDCAGLARRPRPCRRSSRRRSRARRRRAAPLASSASTRRQVLLLVPGGDEHDRVGRRPSPEGIARRLGVAVSC